MLCTVKSAVIILSLGFSFLQCCRSSTPFNPYLSAKEKPSEKQRKEEKKQMVKGEKAYKEQMEQNKKDIRKGRNSLSMKPQYKNTTKTRRSRRKYEFKF